MKDERKRGHKRGHEGLRARGHEDRKAESIEYGVSSIGRGRTQRGQQRETG
jgi:hypothetical protein